MDIICPECHTEYEFDDDRVTDAGVTVKCTNCSYTFKVRRKQASTPPAESNLNQNDSKLWMIRKADGEVLRFRELTTLQQWIIEHKATANDQISRKGDTWKRLGDIAELTSFFEVVHAAKSLTANDKQRSGPAGRAEEYTAGDAGLDDAGLDDAGLDDAGRADDAEPAFANSTMRFDEVGERAAWEGGGVRVSATVDDDDEVLPRRSMGKVLGIISVVLLVAGAASFAVVKPEAIKGIFSSLTGKEQVSEAYAKGRELFLRNDVISLAAAEREFAKAPKESALARAARAEVYTTWAQHLRDDAALLEREASAAEREAATILKALKRAPRAKRPPARNQAQKAERAHQLGELAKASRLRASALKEEAEGKLKVAQVHIRAALVSKSERAEVHRAVADLHRLQGKSDVAALLVKVHSTAPDDPESFYVEGMLVASQGDASRAIKLLKTAILKTRAFSKQILVRANFALGMIHLHAGRYTEAQQQADTVLAANAKHALARKLLGRINAEAHEPKSTDENTRPDAGPVAQAAPDAGSVSTSPPKGKNVPFTFPTSYGALIKAGDKASEYGRSGKALRYYEKALERNKRGVEALVGLGYCEMDVQRFSTARSRFRQALAISATQPDAMLGMAEVYKSLGNKRKALDYFKAFVRTHPNSAKASRARRNVKEFEQALGISGKPTPAPAPAAPAPAAPAPAAPAPAAPAPAAPAPAAPAPAAPAPAAPAPAAPAPAAPAPAAPAPAAPAPAAPAPAAPAPAAPAP
ncbi:MAG: zinc-ribbon domain-containing protein, partial [Deltaproteobacteria bacterium]|nr:zinc-ribbon domain-containing protein [Deltaproteobacteria bacterium]